MKRIVLIAIFILTAGIASAVTLRCDFCGKEINGAYYTYHTDSVGQTVCEECEKQLGHCVRCGVPLAGTNSTDRNVLCRSCRLQVRKCDVCGTMLLATYYSDESGHAFCAECFNNAGRCALCGTILLPGAWSMDGNHKVCNECRRTRPRCAGCNRLLGGSYSTFKGFDGVFCESCVKNTPVCISCLRPCGSHPHGLGNGNSICPECAKTAVIGEQQLELVISSVSRYMARNLLMTIEHPIDFKLVDSTGRQAAHDNRYRESGRFIRFGEDFTIKIVKGLSRTICIETVAHELAHAWQAENWPNLPGDELVEGFAQWTAAKILAGMGYSDMIERLYYRDDVYGRGYRCVADIEQRYGLNGVFNELERRALPQ
ncbi:hypothetical protein JW823_04415 [bacterium]|nr:hypothetical protein [candidate division CSSED10-310 bacterium]